MATSKDKTASKINYADASDYDKFRWACEGLKDFLNEKIADNLLMVTNRYVSSEIEKAKNIVIAPELQELEKLLLEYRNNCKMAQQYQGPGGTMLLSFITKKIKELYGS